MATNNVQPDYLLVTNDICAMFGVRRNVVSNWIARGKIPKPSYIGRTPVWDYATIEAWRNGRTGEWHAVGLQGATI